jgi:hypothetical protein
MIVSAVSAKLPVPRVTETGFGIRFASTGCAVASGVAVGGGIGVSVGGMVGGGVGVADWQAARRNTLRISMAADLCMSSCWIMNISGSLTDISEFRKIAGWYSLFPIQARLFVKTQIT